MGGIPSQQDEYSCFRTGLCWFGRCTDHTAPSSWSSAEPAGTTARTAPWEDVKAQTQPQGCCLSFPECHPAQLHKAPGCEQLFPQGELQSPLTTAVQQQQQSQQHEPGPAQELVTLQQQPRQRLEQDYAAGVNETVSGSLSLCKHQVYNTHFHPGASSLQHTTQLSSQKIQPSKNSQSDSFTAIQHNNHSPVFATRQKKLNIKVIDVHKHAS